MTADDTSSLILINRLMMKEQDGGNGPSFCLAYLPNTYEYERLTEHLHPQELKYYETLRYEKRKKSYLVGRFCAKMSFATVSGENKPEQILIKKGFFNHPVLIYSGIKDNLEIGITHCDNLGAAVTFYQAYPFGVDVERASPDRVSVMERIMTKGEKVLWEGLDISAAVALTAFWTAKEALSKVLKTGMNTPFHVFEISKIEEQEGYFVNHYRYFSQYCCFTFNWGGYVLSLTCPQGTKLSEEFIQDIQGVSARLKLLDND